MSILPIVLAWQPSLGQQVTRALQSFVDDLGRSQRGPVEPHLGQITISTFGPRCESNFKCIDESSHVATVTEPDHSFMSVALLDEVQRTAEDMLADLRSSASSQVQSPAVIVVCSNEFQQELELTADSVIAKIALLGGGPAFVHVFKMRGYGIGDTNFPDKTVGSITIETLPEVGALRSALRQVVSEVARRIGDLSASSEAATPSIAPVSRGGTTHDRPTVVEPSRPVVKVESGLPSGAKVSAPSAGAPTGTRPTVLSSPADPLTSDSVAMPVEPPPRPTLVEPVKVPESNALRTSPVLVVPPVVADGLGLPEVSGESPKAENSEDDPTEDAGKSGWQKLWRKRPKKESVRPEEKLGNVDNPVSGADTSQPEVVHAVIPVQRSVNGPLVVEFDSPLNRKVWHVDSWTKFPEIGPSRDFECEYGNVGSLRVIAGSMRGTKHKYYGDPNQDAYAVRATKNHVIIAVSDGVSSAKYSAYASKYLTDVIVRRVRQALEAREKPTTMEIRQVIQEAAETASAGVSRWRDGELFAPDEPCEVVDIRELAATLTVMVINVELSQEKTRDAVVAFVGDSPCYLLKDLEWTIKTSESKIGDVIDHATSALPVREGRPVVLEWAEIQVAGSESLLLMTDGIGTSLASGRSAVGRWMAPRIAPLLGPQIESNFFDLISFDRNGEDDDRTLVVVLDVNAGNAPQQEESLSGNQ